MGRTGWRTLDVGEQALIFNLQGFARTEDGPARMFLWREKFERLQSYHVNQNEYLIVEKISGKTEHIAGPCSIFQNPLEHARIKSAKAISLDANEVLVVYHIDPKSLQVTRNLQHGPTMYVPHANEWLHDFIWHGTDPSNKTQKIPGQLCFTKLRVIPDQFYYNVDEVRTADDALIRVKLMVFYELTDIEQMLISTQDPFADFITCVCADVVAFASKLTYMEFIEQAGNLNDMKHYPQLQERSKKIGYDISKVVYRGYFAAPTLQNMHNTAMQSRTKLKIQYETEEQQQDLTDTKLTNEMQRMELEQRLELEKLTHQQKMEKQEKQHQMNIKKTKHLEKINQEQEKEQAKMEANKATHRQDEKYFEVLHGLGVNVTDYLVCMNPMPAKVTKVVAGSTSTLHLHQNQ